MRTVRFVYLLLFTGSGQIGTTATPSTSVDASSEWVYMETTSTLLVNGTNFDKEYTKLHFDPPLPDLKFRQQVRTDEYWRR